MNWSQAGLTGFALLFVIYVAIIAADGYRRRANARWQRRQRVRQDYR